MKNYVTLNNLFNRDRKKSYIILGIVLACVFSLTIVFAALSTTLNINGNAEVTAASWDIYLDNIQLNSNSTTSNVPTITDKTTASFTTTLTNPGDYYMFTIDVVNNGSIDAMIDSIEKTPTLTETQSKYLNYIIEYQSGESITTKQLVEQNSFVRLKVKVEFRKDLVASDLPTTSETLNLSFKVKYTQSSESGTTSVENAGKLVKVVSGDYDTVGSEVCVGEECFYVISSTDSDVTMLAKYNLLVGNKYDDTNGVVALETPTGKQSSGAIGYFNGYSVDNPIIGSVNFSNTNYWYNNDKGYLLTDYGLLFPAYVYDSNSILYGYIEKYKIYLSNLGVVPNVIRLITYEELNNLGCISDEWSCREAPNWVYSTSYWSGTSIGDFVIWSVVNDGVFAHHNYKVDNINGIRPVITISKSEF